MPEWNINGKKQTYEDKADIEVSCKEDKVNHPQHYCRDGAIECFDEFEMIFGPTVAMHACLFNLWKYRYRAADKNGAEDLAKSDWYARKYQYLKEKIDDWGDTKEYEFKF